MSELRAIAVDLFTPDEHAVLASWFGAKPPTIAQDIIVDEAISRLGFDKKADPYRRIDAAVAFIVLERAEQRLPQWSTIRDDELILAREYRDATKIPNRKVVLQPRHLFTINWADSGPGFSWPMAYYVTWVPYYDRFVVTASADCPDMFGYCDFALGAFGIDKPIKEGARETICPDWTKLRAFEQGRWVSLLETGLVSEAEAEAWAKEVWPSEPGEEDEDDFYRRIGGGPVAVARPASDRKATERDDNDGSGKDHRRAGRAQERRADRQCGVAPGQQCADRASHRGSRSPRGDYLRHPGRGA